MFVYMTVGKLANGDGIDRNLANKGKTGTIKKK